MSLVPTIKHGNNSYRFKVQTAETDNKFSY